MAKRFLSILLCLALLLCGAFAVSADEDTGTTDMAQNEKVQGYELIAENNSYKLYADTQKGDFAVYDIAADRLWYSGQWEVLDSENPISELNSGRIKTDLVSMVAVNFVQVSTIASTAAPSYQNSYAYCVIKDNVTVQKISNGYIAEYYFNDIESTVPVEITLTENGISARIIAEKLKISDEYCITSIELLPGFMAADNRYDGYMFLPSGSGGIIPLASGKGDIAVYSEMVYGRDIAIELEEYEGETQNILVPVYGLKSGSSAITAIISQGDSSAYITAEADSSTTSFSRVYSEYVTAIVDDTTLFESNFENQRIIYGAEQRESFEDYVVDYVFLRGEDADYSGMAAVYRDTLKFKDEASAPTLSLTLYGAATKKASFLGIPYTKKIALTSFSQAQKITELLNEKNVPVALRYIGWNANGVENKKVPSKFSPASVLGGKKDFKKLHSFIESSDNTVFYDLDFVTIRKSSWGFSTLSDVCRSIFNTRTPQYKYMRSVYVPVNTENPSYILKPASVVKAGESFLNDFDFNGGISFDKIGAEIYSDFSKESTTREDAQKLFENLLKKASDKRQVSVDIGNAYTFEYVNRINELPTSNDGNLLFSESVPFVQMVLHGNVSYSANSAASLLDCIEYGAEPSYVGIYAEDNSLIETSFNWLYGTTYTKWLDDAAESYKAYSEIYKSLYNKAITEHSSENGVSVTGFEDGTKIYVNRNEEVAVVNGVQIPASGYTVIGG